MTLPVDLTSQNFFRDPAATVRRLQAAGPVVEVGFPMVGRVWMTTTQEMASRVLKDGKLFTMRKDGGAVPGMRWWMPRIIGVLTNHMLTVDEPDHATMASMARSTSVVLRTPVAINSTPNVGAAGVIVAR
jgi:hypothetical protein